jgi:hypothetical protein
MLRAGGEARPRRAVPDVGDVTRAGASGRELERGLAGVHAHDLEGLARVAVRRIVETEEREGESELPVRVPGPVVEIRALEPDVAVRNRARQRREDREPERRLGRRPRDDARPEREAPGDRRLVERHVLQVDEIDPEGRLNRLDLFPNVRGVELPVRASRLRMRVERAWELLSNGRRPHEEEAEKKSA